jgi:hypothetical protein
MSNNFKAEMTGELACIAISMNEWLEESKKSMMKIMEEGLIQNEKEIIGALKNFFTTMENKLEELIAGNQEHKMLLGQEKSQMKSWFEEVVSITKEKKSRETNSRLTQIQREMRSFNRDPAGDQPILGGGEEQEKMEVTHGIQMEARLMKMGLKRPNEKQLEPQNHMT